MLAGMGTISNGIHATTQTGSGVPTAIGNFELTGTSQRIFHKLGTAYDYQNNMYTVNARTLADNVIEFDIQFQDNADGGGDPNVTGDILSPIHTDDLRYICIHPPRITTRSNYKTIILDSINTLYYPIMEKNMPVGSNVEAALYNDYVQRVNADIRYLHR